MVDSIRHENGHDATAPGGYPGREHMPNSRTRRPAEPRNEIDTTAVIHLVDLAAKVDGRIVDISHGGCRVLTHRPFPLGAFRRVEVEFYIDSVPFRFPGVTQTIYDPRSVGIRFLDLSDRKKEQLHALLSDIQMRKACGA